MRLMEQKILVKAVRLVEPDRGITICGASKIDGAFKNWWRQLN